MVFRLPGQSLGLQNRLFKTGWLGENALDILEHLGKHPAADRLLVNLIRYAGQYARGPLAKLPARFDKLLADLKYTTPAK